MTAQITEETITLLKQLARIDCSKAEEKELLHDLGKILHYFELLEELDTEGVPPCNQVIEDMVGFMRDDEVKDAMTRECFLKNAPAAIGGMIKVPQVLKKTH